MAHAKTRLLRVPRVSHYAMFVLQFKVCVNALISSGCRGIYTTRSVSSEEPFEREVSINSHHYELEKYEERCKDHQTIVTALLY